MLQNAIQYVKVARTVSFLELPRFLKFEIIFDTVGLTYLTESRNLPLLKNVNASKIKKEIIAQFLIRCYSYLFHQEIAFAKKWTST